MAKRKSGFISDGSDSGISDEEFDPDDNDKGEFGRQRRTGGKREAWEGVFGEEVELDYRPTKRRKGGERTTTFVKASEKQPDSNDILNIPPVSADLAMRGDASSSSGSSSDERDSDNDKPEKVPREKESEQDDDVEDTAPRIGLGSSTGGIGMGARPSISVMMGVNTPLSSGTNTPRTGLSGGKPSLPQDNATETRRSFLGSQNSPAASAPKKTTLNDLSKEERIHFQRLQSKGGAALKMLEKMGWKAGEGLGKDGAGRVTPVMSTLRPKQMGLAYDGFKEKAKPVTVEERNKEKIQNDREKVTKKESWKRPQKKKVQHRTYEEILAMESGAAEHKVDSALGVIIDATGATLKELPSLPSSLAFVPTYEREETRLPELWHNVNIILSQVNGDLKGLAREGNEIRNRRLYLEKEKELIQASQKEATERRKRLEGATEVVNRLFAIVATDEHSLKNFDEPIQDLIGLYADIYLPMKLDDAVIAALSSPLKRLWNTWDPLTQPTFLCTQLTRWKSAFRLNDADDSVKGRRVMTAYESLIWNAWLPRVRSAVNNLWDPSDSTSVVTLFRSYLPILPPFISDNFIAQLLTPKLISAIDEWTPRSPCSLASIVLPWLEVVGEHRLVPVMEDVKRRLQWWLKGWRVKASAVDVWKEALIKKEWEDLCMKYVLPKLGKEMRHKFTVNPREQDLDALEYVLEWKNLLSKQWIDQLLEKEFFPKWVDALYTWLVADPNMKEIADWYDWWKDYFGEDIVSLPGFKNGLSKARDLINQALILKGDVKHRLKRPDLTSLGSIPPTAKPSRTGSQQKTRVHEEISFKHLVEELAEENDLIFLPTGKAEEKTGSVIYKLGKEADSKKGIMVYLKEDVAWVRLKDEPWKPVGLEELIRLGKT